MNPLIISAFLSLAAQAESAQLADEVPQPVNDQQPAAAAPATPVPVPAAPPPDAAPATVRSTPQESSRAKVLVLRPTGENLSPQVMRTISDLVAQALQKDQRLSVTTGADLEALMDTEASRQELGCATSSCLADLAGALDAKLIVTTHAAQLGDTIVITLTLYNAATQSSDARESVQVTELGALPKQIEAAVLRMRGQVVPESVDSGIEPLFVGGIGLAALGAVAGGVGAYLGATAGTRGSSAGERQKEIDSIGTDIGIAAVGGLGLLGGVALITLSLLNE